MDRALSEECRFHLPVFLPTLSVLRQVHNSEGTLSGSNFSSIRGQPGPASFPLTAHMLTDCRPGHVDKGPVSPSRFSSANIARKTSAGPMAPVIPLVGRCRDCPSTRRGVPVGKTDCPRVPMVRGSPRFYGCLYRKAQKMALSEFKAPCLGVRQYVTNYCRFGRTDYLR